MFDTKGVKIADGTRVEGYSALETVLMAAYAHAACTKGAERHANGKPFDEQPMLEIARLLGDTSGPAFQVIKKLREGLKMAEAGKTKAALLEFLGAINYIAGVAILVSEKAEKTAPQKPVEVNPVNLKMYSGPHEQAMLDFFHQHIGKAKPETFKTGGEYRARHPMGYVSLDKFPPPTPAEQFMQEVRSVVAIGKSYDRIIADIEKAYDRSIGLCVDEGCIHHGTKHICIPRFDK